jgi:hypothetical protein
MQSKRVLLCLAVACLPASGCESLGGGTVFAELTEKWCPGQVWTITGKGEGSLEDG